jgi:hypothetical protein
MGGGAGESGKAARGRAGYRGNKLGGRQAGAPRTQAPFLTPSHPQSRSQALVAAARYGNLSATLRLLANARNIDLLARDRHGHTAVEYAQKYGHTEIEDAVVCMRVHACVRVPPYVPARVHESCVCALSAHPAAEAPAFVPVPCVAAACGVHGPRMAPTPLPTPSPCAGRCWRLGWYRPIATPRAGSLSAWRGTLFCGPPGPLAPPRSRTIARTRAASYGTGLRATSPRPAPPCTAYGVETAQ